MYEIIGFHIEDTGSYESDNKECQIPMNNHPDTLPIATVCSMSRSSHDIRMTLESFLKCCLEEWFVSSKFEKYGL